MSKRSRAEDAEDGSCAPEKKIPKVKDGKFSIKWSMEQNLGMGPDENDLDSYLHRYTGTLIKKAMNENYEEEERVAGKIQLWRIKAHNIQNHGLRLFDTLDVVSQELAEIGVILETLDGTIEDSPINMAHDIIRSLMLTARESGAIPKTIKPNEVGEGWEICTGDYVYVDRMIIHKEYRGYGLGLYLLDAAASVINGPTSLTLIKPFPLQHELDSLPRQDIDMYAIRPPDYPPKGSLEEDMKKLSAYYRKLGFRKLGNEMLGMWNGYIQPSLLTAAPKLKEIKL